MAEHRQESGRPERLLSIEVLDQGKGLARKLQLSVKNFTGKKLAIFVGDRSAEDEEDFRAQMVDSLWKQVEANLKSK